MLLSATAVSDILVELQYSENVTPTWNTAADWTATGLTSTGAAQNADNSIVNLSVTSLGNTGYTASDFALTINDDASDQVLDGGGNNAADVAGFNVDDGQLPVLLSMTLAGDNSNGFLTFSEGVYRNPGSNALRINNEIDFSMTSGGATPTGDGVANFVHVAGASTVTFDLDFTGTPDGTEVLTAQLDGIGELFDLAGNEGAFPQSVQANLNDTGPPAIVSGTMAPDNTYIDVEFNEGVYDSDGSSPLAADGSDFDISFVMNSGGSVTDVTITGATNTSGGALVGGETTVRVVLNQVNPPASGAETIEITPVLNSIYDASMNVSPVTETTGAVNLIDLIAPSGYSVTIDAGDDPNKINVTNETAFSFTFAGAEVGVTYNYSIDDTNVGTAAVIGNGVIATATDQISGIDVSSLDDDLLTLTVYLTDANSNQGGDVTDDITKDTSPPVFTAGPTVTDIIQKISFTLNFNADEDGTIYWATVDNDPGGSGDGLPHITVTPTQIKNATAGANLGTCIVSGCKRKVGESGSFTFSAGTVSQVIAQTKFNSYDIFFVAEGNTTTGSGALQTTESFEGDAQELSIVITNMTASNTDGSYGIGSVITVQVTFDQAVNVTLSPRILLETGTTDQYATYNGTGSGTMTLEFDYTVVEGDVTSDLEYESSNDGIDLNGGTIAGTITVNLDLPDIGGGNSLGDNKNIVIDGIRPVLSATVATPNSGLLGVGGVITIDIDGNETGLVLEGVPNATVNGVDVSGTFVDNADNTYTFTYTIQEGHTDRAANALPVSITLEDLVGNTSTTSTFTSTTPAVDANTPTVSTTVLNPDNGTVIVGQSVTVTLTEGGAETGLAVGSVATINGVDVSVSFTDNANGTYTFTYTLTDMDADWAAGILAVDLRIKDAANNEVTVNTLPANTLAGDANLPDITAVTITSTNADPNYAKVGDVVTVTITANEALDVPSISSVFTSGSVAIANADTPGGTFPNYTTQYITDVTDTEGLVEFTINYTDDAGNPGTTVVAVTDGTSVTFDKTDPTLVSLLPINNKFSVPIDANLTITLDDNLIPNPSPSSEIRLYEWDGVTPTLIESFTDVANHLGISFSGADVTINPTLNLTNGKQYYIEIDAGTILDKASNPYAGFLGNSDWLFQTFANAVITDIMETIGAAAICVESDIIIEGQYFIGYTNNEGVTQVEFCYVSDGITCFTANQATVSVISDTQLQVEVPPNMLEDVNVRLTKAQDVTPIGTNPLSVTGLSVDQAAVGPTSAVIQLDGANTVCSEGTTASTIRVSIVSGTAPYTIEYKVNGGPAIPVSNYISLDPIPVDPPVVGPNDYTLFSVTDANGCTVPVPAGLDQGNAVTITEFTKSNVTVSQVPPVCLVGLNSGDMINLTGLITGSSQTGTWSPSNGTGSFSSIMDDGSGNHSTDYAFTAQDFALDTLFITLTSTNSSAPCVEDSDVIKITFTTSQSADMGPDKIICLDVPNPDVFIVGIIGGGATQGTWSTNGDGTWDGPITNIPVDGNSQVSITYTLGNNDVLNGTVQITLAPSGGTCGTPIDGTLNIDVNTLPIPSKIADNNTFLCVNSTLVPYKVINTPGSTYNWSLNPPGNGSIVVGQGTDKIFVDWGSTDGDFDVEVIETDQFGCQSVLTFFDVTLNPLPIPGFVKPLARSFSTTAPNVDLIGGFQSGAMPFDPTDPTTYTIDVGVFSGNGVIQDANGDYFFDPDVAGITTVGNEHDIVFTYTDINGCINSITEQFTVFDASASVVIVGTGDAVVLASEYCEDNGILNVEVASTFTPAIGFEFDKFSGPGVTDNGDGTAFYDPQAAADQTGGGSKLVEYTQREIANPANVIPFGSQVTTVNLIPQLAPDPIPLFYCDNEAPISLTRDAGINPLNTFTFSVVGGDPNGLIDNPSTGVFNFIPGNEVFTADDYTSHVITIEYFYEDDKGCDDVTQFNVTIFQRPPAPTTSDKNACEGQDLGTLTVDNPVTGANIRWYDNAALTGDPFIGTIFSPVITQDITLFYVTQEINGCESIPTDVKVEVFPLPSVDMTGFDDPAEYCVDADSFLLNLTPAAGGVFSGDIDGVVDNGDGTFSFSPLAAAGGDIAILDPISLTLIYSFTIAATGCTDQVIQPIIINPINFVQILNLQEGQEFCVDDVDYELTPNISTGSEGTGEFTGDGIVSGNIFRASAAGVGTHPITYTFTNNNGCVDFQTLNVIVNPLPVPSFDVGISCAVQDVQFTSTTPGNIVQWNWNFNDVNATGSTNTSILENPAHIFNVPGTYNVDLTVIDDKGCQATVTNTITVGEIPQPEFDFEAIAEQKDSWFQNTTPALDNSVQNQVKWTFAEWDGTLIDEIIITDPAIITSNDPIIYVFANTGRKRVTLEITTDRGCISSITKEFFIVPFVDSVTALNYIENFNNSTHGWISWGFDSPNSEWVLGTATGDFEDQNRGESWYTIPNSDQTDISFVYSPCFDISGLVRPVVTLNTYTHTKNGALLQYSTDGRFGVWKTLGSEGSGIEWYDTSLDQQLQTIPGNPVGYGWQFDNSGWQESRHTLTDISTGRENVVFRILFKGIEGSPPTQGFAFDDFRISDRDRIVVLEHFENEVTTNAVNLVDHINPIGKVDGVLNTSEIVKIQYRTGFGGDDNIYDENRSDVNARALFYDITSANRAIIDGDNSDDGLFMDWGLTMFGTKSLTSPDVEYTDISISQRESAEVDVQVKLKALVDLPDGGIITHVIVVENPVDGKEYVMRKMLPDAAGTLSESLKVSDNEVTLPTVTWENPFASDFTNLSVIVFTQLVEADNDGINKTLQAAIEPLVIDGQKVITGIDEIISDDLLLYPNPASETITVVFKTYEEKTVRVFDQFGKMVYHKDLVDGIRSHQIETGKLASGVYFIQIESTDNQLIREKFILSH